MQRVGTLVALATFLLPVLTYFALLLSLEPHPFLEDPKHGQDTRLDVVLSCTLIFSVVGLVTLFTFLAVHCLVTDARLKVGETFPDQSNLIIPSFSA